LWLWVFVCAGAILVSQFVGAAYAADEETTESGTARFILVIKQLHPFLYGLLGALTYLLRSAHDYIAERSFDLKRIPEYYNRMLLGFVGGGVILLFVDPKSIGFGADAVAFAVGYNTDTLFDVLERVASAVTAKTKDGGTAASKPGRRLK